MIPVRSAEHLRALVQELRALATETEWVEFKENRADPDEIGQYISALANGAALVGQSHGYVIWGIRDRTHEIVGTTFEHRTYKVGNEELESWLLRLLNPRINFRFLDVEVDAKAVVILEVDRAWREPIRFRNMEYIRVGSYRKPLKEYPEKERQLWRCFENTPFENGLAASALSGDEALGLLDHPSYFRLLGLPVPGGDTRTLEAMQADGLVQKSPGGRVAITNLGAVLFAKDLSDFPGLKRKALRIIEYKGAGRIETQRELLWQGGYAAGFEALITYINLRLPSNEVIGKALRRHVPMYPELAVREVVANALIHQDFSVTGAGPTVEIFEGRIEVTSPGQPLVNAARFLDSPPRSRNEALASLMRRMGVCEERGSGVDKIVSQAEFYQLPAPLFEAPEGATRVTLFAHLDPAEMTRDDRVRACYLHACLRYVQRQEMTNATVRERFGIDKRNAATASRYIREAVVAGMIGPEDAGASKKQMRYVPYWAMTQPVSGEPR